MQNDTCSQILLDCLCLKVNSNTVICSNYLFKCNTEPHKGFNCQHVRAIIVYLYHNINCMYHGSTSSKLACYHYLWSSMTNVTISVKTSAVRTSMYIEKTKFKNYLWNYACYWKIFTRIYWAININKGSFKPTKNIPSYSPGYGKLENLLFRFCSLNSDCVTYVCLQCGRCKQNRYLFLGKTATIDKCTVSLRFISITY